MKWCLANRKRGFTVTEIIIVVVIISILSGLAILSYSGYRNYLRLRSAASEITSLLSAARSLAINQNGYYRAGFLIETGTFWIDEIDSFGNISKPKVIHERHISTHVKIDSIVVEGNEYTSGFVYIVFYPDSTTQFSTIYLKKEGSPDMDEEYYTIKVYPATGRARVYQNQRR